MADSRTHHRLGILAAVILVAAGAWWFGPGAATRADERDTRSSAGPRFTKTGELVRPDGWREWVFVGTPVTPNDMNDGQAAFPEFHNVYVDPASFAEFRRTGEFPDGTMVAKELVSVGTKQASSGNGYFQGEFQGLEISVKDRRRFGEEPGGWAFFSFGHQKEYTKTARALPTAKCNACHEANAETDYVFTQFYPVLRAAMEEAKRGGQSQETDEDGDGNAATRGRQPKYEQALFEFLKGGKYADYVGEKRVRPSKARQAHGNVRTFLNDELAESLRAGNETHPVGAFAVKELHAEGKLIGWATAYKRRHDDGTGEGWYWFENLSTKDVERPVASGYGVKLCTSCHGGGTDFVLSDWPLK